MLDVRIGKFNHHPWNKPRKMEKCLENMENVGFTWQDMENFAISPAKQWKNMKKLGLAMNKLESQMI